MKLFLLCFICLLLLAQLIFTWGATLPPGQNLNENPASSDVQLYEEQGENIKAGECPKEELSPRARTKGRECGKVGQECKEGRLCCPQDGGSFCRFPELSSYGMLSLRRNP